MKTRIQFAAILVLVLSSSIQADTFGSGDKTFDIDFVAIGNPGNFADTTGDPNLAGSVPYAYGMGKFEISEDMISKANVLGGLGISKSTRGANKPATNMNWLEAAKFVNWLNTSTGNVPAYKFDGSGIFQLWQSGDAGYNPMNRYRNSLATYVLPSANEWYKAAYHDASAGTAGTYFDYPTGGDSAPTAVASGTVAATAVYNQLLDSGPAEITLAGGLSPYGTMGQGGNVAEWEETDFDLVNNSTSSARGIRGGDWSSLGPSTLSASYRGFGVGGPTIEDGMVGFRVAIMTSVSVLLGDYNRNGIVDAADYVVWRDTVGQIVPECGGADFNCNTFVEVGEYQPWQENFGRTFVSGNAAGSEYSQPATNVPEPASLSLGVFALALIPFLRRASDR